MVGLILVSNSPVLALAADDVSQPENQTPAVEIVENIIPEVVEVTEEPVVEVIVEVVEEVATSTDETILEVVVEEATSTEPVLIDESVDLEVTPEVVEAAKAMTTEATDTATDNSFAISAEFGGTSASTTTNPIDGGQGEFTTLAGNNTETEGNFTTLPSDGCTSDCGGNQEESAEDDFTTLPSGGCTSGCGCTTCESNPTVSTEGNFTTLPNSGCTTSCGTTPVVSAENNFRTLSDSGCTTCDTDPVVSGENSFNTLSAGGGCTSDCGPDGEEVVSGENSFTTSTNGGGGGCSGDCDDDDNGGGGGSRRHRDRDRDPLPLPCEVYLKKFIRLGYANDPFEVTKLEVFLNAFEGFDLPVNGIYEQHDFEAVSIFQKRYLGAVLTPWAIDDSTGYVYITTTLTINQIYCRHTVGNDLDLRSVYPVYNPATGEVEGFTSTSTSSTTPSIDEIPGFFDAAAMGLLDFIKDWWCLLAIIILILIIAYLLDERERLAKKLEEAKRAGVTEIIIPPHFEETDVEGTFIPGEEVDEDQKPLL